MQMHHLYCLIKIESQCVSMSTVLLGVISNAAIN